MTFLSKNLVIVLTALLTQPAQGMTKLRQYLFPAKSHALSSHHKITTEAQKESDAKRARLREQGIPDFTLNMQWINAKLNPEQKFIHPSSNSLTLRKNLLMSLYSWAQKNPDSQGVVLWYDSKLTPPEAVENTRKIITQDRALMQFFKKKTAPIILKDVRDLPEVKADPEVFSEKSPIYFRVDLLRAIAAYNSVKNTKQAPRTKSESNNAYIYADLDMPSIPTKELFDYETMKNLRLYGIVLAKQKQTFNRFENGFQIVTDYNDKLLKAMNYALIKPGVASAHLGIPTKYNLDNEMYHALHELVFRNYSSMFNYFYHLEDVGKVRYRDNIAGIDTPYSKEKHGMKPFVVTPHEFRGFRSLDFIPDDSSTQKNKFPRDKYGPIMPTKTVDLPKSEHLWNNEIKKVNKERDRIHGIKRKASFLDDWFY